MKIICKILILVIVVTVGASAQVVNDGGSIEVEAGSIVSIEGDFTNETASSVTNNGEIEITGNMVNEVGGILNGSDSSLYKFSGNQNSQITLNGDSLDNVSLNKDAGFNVVLQDMMTIKADLEFNADQNKLVLGDASLHMISTNAISGFDADDYIQADGMGYLRLPYVSLVASDFPVGGGSDHTNLNVDLVGGTPASGDYIEVRVVDEEHPELRAEVEDRISRYWVVKHSGITGYEANAVGSYLDADIVGLETNIKGTSYESIREWTQKNQDGDDVANTITISLDELSEEVTGANTLGVYDIKFFMQGPYSVSGDTMKADLNKDTTGMIVNILEVNGLKCPYDTNVTVAANFFIDHPSIVDWVLVEFRDAADSVSVIDTIVGFVDVNGKLLDIGGGENITRVNADKSWVVIKHRNHLGVTTSSAISLDDEGKVTYDFTTSQNKAWDSPTITNDQMAELETGVYGLTRGDANGNGKNNVSDLIKSKIAAEPNQADVYKLEDVNLNGKTNVADIVQTKINSSPNQEQHVPK